MSRYPQKYRDHQPGGKGANSTRELDGRIPTDLAHSLTPKVRVSCILSPEDIIWGTYRNDAVAIIHLQIRTNEPPGYKLRHFQLSITFTSKAHNTRSTPAASPEVWLLQDPSPSPLPEYIEGRPWTETQHRSIAVEPTIQLGSGGGSLGSVSRATERSVFQKWQFRSYPGCDENNHPITATWIWESNKNNPMVEDRGVLYGAVVVRHGTADLILECRVEGKLCRDFQWLSFGTKKSEPAIWSRKPEAVTDDVKDALEGLKSKIQSLNTAAAARVLEPI